MKRRKTIKLLGATILSGTTIQTHTNPALATEFKVSETPYIKPNDLNAILIKFNTFKITPKYLDESSNLTIQTSLDLENGSYTKTKEATGIDSKNGNTIKTDTIQNQTDKDLSYIQIDSLQFSKDIIHGTIQISITHPSIGTETYTQKISISNGNPIPTNTIATRYSESSQNNIELYNVQNGEKYNEITDVRGEITLTDDFFIYAAGNQNIIVRNNQFNEQYKFTDPSNNITDTAVSPNEEWLGVTVNAEKVYLYDLTDGTLQTTFTKPVNNSRGIGMSNSYLAYGDRNNSSSKIYVHDLSDRSFVREFTDPGWDTTGVTVHNDEVAYGANANELHVSRISDGTSIYNNTSLPGSARSVDFNENYLAAYIQDNYVAIRDRTDYTTNTYKFNVNRSGGPGDLNISENQVAYTTTTDRIVQNLNDGTEILRLSYSSAGDVSLNE